MTQSDDSTTTAPEATVMLQPIAAPSVLGNFALASALIVYGTWFTGAWGNATSPESFFPFVLLFGGAGQMAAALMGYRARDAVAAALHGSWAAFWLGVGVIYLMAATGDVKVPAQGAHWGSMGQWFIYMAVVTWTTAAAALARSPAQFAAQATLGTGSALAAWALLSGSSAWAAVAGWIMVAAAAFAVYAGAAAMLDAVYGVTLLPFRRRGPSGRPALAPMRPVQYRHGDPGVKAGQ